jgi:hypothetical protein
MNTRTMLILAALTTLAAACANQPSDVTVPVSPDPSYALYRRAVLGATQGEILRARSFDPVRVEQLAKPGR